MYRICKEYAGDMQGICGQLYRENAGNMQGVCGEYVGNMQEYAGNMQGICKEYASTKRHREPERQARL
jgi:hypothetical protein